MVALSQQCLKCDRRGINFGTISKCRIAKMIKTTDAIYLKLVKCDK